MPRYIEFSERPDEEINLAFLQAAALISFDPSSHAAMRESGLVGKIVRAGLLKVALLTLKHEDIFERTVSR